MNEELLNEYGFVKSSSYRAKVLNVLFESAGTPTAIAKKCGIRVNHISKVLSDLKSHGLIICVNENVRKGRVYIVTPLGKEVGTFCNNLDGGIWVE